MLKRPKWPLWLSCSFQNAVSKYGSQFQGNSQHDALEFLLWLLDRVHEDLEGSARGPTADKVSHPPDPALCLISVFFPLDDARESQNAVLEFRFADLCVFWLRHTNYRSLLPLLVPFVLEKRFLPLQSRSLFSPSDGASRLSVQFKV